MFVTCIRMCAFQLNQVCTEFTNQGKIIDYLSRPTSGSSLVLTSTFGVVIGPHGNVNESLLVWVENPISGEGMRETDLVLSASSAVSSDSDVNDDSVDATDFASSSTFGGLSNISKSLDVMLEIVSTVEWRGFLFFVVFVMGPLLTNFPSALALFPGAYL